MCATTPSIVVKKQQRHHPQNEDQFLELEVSQLSRQTSPARPRSCCMLLAALLLEGLNAARRNNASNHHIFNDKMSNYSWFLVDKKSVKLKWHKIQYYTIIQMFNNIKLSFFASHMKLSFTLWTFNRCCHLHHSKNFDIGMISFLARALHLPSYSIIDGFAELSIVFRFWGWPPIKSFVTIQKSNRI